jgi:N-acetylmuramoyl-L-alanine amidase
MMRGHSEGRLENQTPTADRGCFRSLFILAFVLGIAYVVWLSAGASDREKNATPGSETSGQPASTKTPRPTRTARPTKTPRLQATATAAPRPWRVSIVAGHWQNDSGAVCDDGLQEVTINLDVASRVVAILQSEGYDAELLPEFSEKLAGLQADAFVSIHTDSCAQPDLSGFKVARVAGSAIPEQEDRLVACLSREYALATGLVFHKDTITFDMTGYHAFGEIDPQTPGAIIELGFMATDRELLTKNSYEVAQGVARGIACFLEGD